VQFVPENEFESSLVKAATDPAHRPQFYKDLCSADLFIIQHGEEAPVSHERVTLEQGKTIQIQKIEHNGKFYIPVFSSISCLQRVITEEVAYLGVNALELMKFTQGAELLLNPGSDYDKEFTKNEIQSIDFIKNLADQPMLHL
jgi:SseB protein N-terminal domain